MIYTLYYIMKQFALLSLRLHESFLALRLAFTAFSLPIRIPRARIHFSKFPEPCIDSVVNWV